MTVDKSPYALGQLSDGTSAATARSVSLLATASTSHGLRSVPLEETSSRGQVPRDTRGLTPSRCCAAAGAQPAIRTHSCRHSHLRIPLWKRVAMIHAEVHDGVRSGMRS